MELKLPKDLIKDELLEIIELVEALQNTADMIMRNIIIQSRTIKMQPSIYIGYVILIRVIECINSIRILSIFGLDRDAAILLLNLIELRLDILYISLDEEHADVWLNHEKETEKPWRVGSLFRELYKDRNELEAEIENYKRFSMIKHGNPVGGIQSFPIEITKRKLIFSDKKLAQDRLAIYLFACGTECCIICNTVIGIAEKYGFSLSNCKKLIDKLQDLLRKSNTVHVYDLLYKLKSIIILPDLCKNCHAIPENRIEITCLLRQADSDSYTEDGKFKCDRFK